MDDRFRRVAGTVLRIPFTGRTVRELVYCGISGLAGAAGFLVTVFSFAASLTITASILGTVVGLLLLTLALLLARRLGALHRRIARWLLRCEVAAPQRFLPGKGILGRLDRRLRDRVAWRAVSYSLIKLPVAAVQLYALTLAGFGLVDVSYPALWLLFHHNSSGTLVAGVPLPFWGSFNIGSWPGTLLAALTGAALVIAGAWLTRGINAADRALVRGLLGPSRISELERTRTLAVEDSATALRRVERDLHDGAQMRLAALAMNLGMARDKLSDDDETPQVATVRELLDAAQRNAMDALADLRDLARGIHPPALDNGLASALTSLAASSAIPASVTDGIGPRPAPAIETIAYFCAAELIANATKHSYANEIKVNIHTERGGVLRLEVCDDGIGGADSAHGSGLAGLAQRVSTVDGRIDVSSPPGGPTLVTVTLPLKA
ncbi:MAG: sensor domain-containing protein [Streptosporangiaceae bacterium]